jgi:predicted DsbA family dithiol-disulfide isomerase
MAMETPKITADVIQAQEFPYLARSYAVQSVPKIVINKVVEVLGAVPEATLLQRLLTAVGQEALLAEMNQPLLPATAGGPTTLVGK